MSILEKYLKKYDRKHLILNIQNDANYDTLISKNGLKLFTIEIINPKDIYQEMDTSTFNSIINKFLISLKSLVRH